jgi:predicted dehydrogenase
MKNELKIAIDGLQTGHIIGMRKGILRNTEVEIVAVAEPDPDSCKATVDACGLQITHDSLDALLDEVDFDILLLNTRYALRGSHAIRALQADKHIFSDKPLCLSLSDLDQIEFLSHKKNLSVFAYLSLRYNPFFMEAGRRLANGDLGDIATILVTGRHPLKYGKRERWFFEPGAQGGTINDILIHGIDAVEGLTGQRIQQVVAGRQWNQQLPNEPHFCDCAQVMFTMKNGAGVFMDGSFTTPPGHREPWQLCFSGSEGDMTLTTGSLTVRLADSPKEAVVLEEDIKPRCILEDLACEIHAESGEPLIMDTEKTLRATRVALTAQQIANTQRSFVDL